MVARVVGYEIKAEVSIKSDVSLQSTPKLIFEYGILLGGKIHRMSRNMALSYFNWNLEPNEQNSIIGLA